MGQTTPEVEFNRFAVKDPAALAQKPGGPTERIEVQSTNDNIDYVVKAYTLQNANAAEAFQIVREAVALEGGNVTRIAAGSSVTIGPNGVETTYNGQSYLVVTAPDWMIPYLDQMIATLDVPGLESSAIGTGYAFYRSRHRRPSELAGLIAASVASPTAVAVADDSRNVLYLDDTPSHVGIAVEALSEFDRPPDQIEVHVRIFEIEQTDSLDLGVDWYAWKKTVSGGDLSFVWGQPGTTDMNLESLTGSLSFSPALATEFLNYLARDGRAKILTDTRVRVTNGEVATINSTTQIPYVVRNFVGGGVADQPFLDSPQATGANGVIKEFSEGVTVTLSPVIGTQTVEMRIQAAVSSHVGYTPLQSVPIISTSTMNSVLDLNEGIPSVLGGLSRRTNVAEISGIPLLKSIPGLRYLFSRETTRERVGEIFVCVVPTRVNQSLPSDMMPEEYVPEFRSRARDDR